MPKPTKKTILTSLEGTGLRVSEPAALAVVQARLAKKAARFISWLPPDGERASRAETVSYFEQASQIASEIRVLHDYMASGRVQSDFGYAFEFSVDSYDKFEKQSHALARAVGKRKIPALAERSRIMGIHRDILGEAVLEHPSRDALTASGASKWIAKLLAALGVKDVWAAIVEVLEQNWPTMLERLGVLIAEKNWKSVAVRLGSLLDILCSKPFMTVLAEKIGKKEAAKVIGNIAAKSVPILGWTILIGSFVWAVAEEYV